MNVLTGERYKVILTEVKNYLKGLYGQPPGEIDPDLLKKVLRDEEPFKGRPADLLEPMLEKTKEEMKNEITSEEDILSYILFPQVARAFFKKRAEQRLSSGSKATHGPSEQAAGNNPSGPKASSDAATLHLDKLYTVDETLLFSEEKGKRRYFTYPSA
jgi:oxaloacetate decarboxylase alpha subunit